MELIHPTTYALILPIESFRVAASKEEYEKAVARERRPPYVFESQCRMKSTITTALRMIFTWLYSGTSISIISDHSVILQAI
jgi:hypothetical protein